MADFDGFAAHVADSEATRFITALDRKDAWRVFGCATGSYGASPLDATSAALQDEQLRKRLLTSAPS
jgi:hypothetical protein